MKIECKINCGNKNKSTFDSNNITETENKIIRVFDCFVNLNSYLKSTYGTICFNLRDIGLLDYILKSTIIKDNKDELEIGKTGARIFFNLFNHLLLIPDKTIRTCLTINFPKNYELYLSGKRTHLFSNIDYYQGLVKEERFETFKDAYKNY